MDKTGKQGRLFPDPGPSQPDVVWINDRCRIQTKDGYRVVSVSGITLAHYAVGDQMSEENAIVSLFEQGWARQIELVRAFDVSDRTIRRYLEKFGEGGLAALGRGRGFPAGQSRVPSLQDRKVAQWKAQGLSNREIAGHLGVNESSVRKKLRRIGWKPKLPVQAQMLLQGAAQNCPVFRSGGFSPEKVGEKQEEDLGPNLSGFSDEEDMPISLANNPADRSFDRICACLGLLTDAKPLFREGKGVAGVGVLLALPALVESRVFAIAREVYGGLGAAFYGLRSTLVTMLLMALLRIRQPEGLKEHSPKQLGRLLGLDRAPEVKTLRRKLSRMAGWRRAADFGRALARHRVETRGHAIGFLYVDGHVRVYHGKRKLPKTHVARMRRAMPATTDYWVNDALGDPLFVVSTEANPGLVKVLPGVLTQVRELVGERSVTVIFDRGGWSPKLFIRLIAEGFDIMTYRKGRCRRISRNRFSSCKKKIEGRKIEFMLADQGVWIGKKKARVRLRQITRLCDDGHQTPIITSRRDLTAVEVAYRMFERWRQENFFKYLREEYALDMLVDYKAEPADPKRMVPNPLRKKLDAELRKARSELLKLDAEFGIEAAENLEQERPTMRGFKISHASLSRKVQQALKKVVDLENRRGSLPMRIPVGRVVEGEVVKLAVEKKHLTSLIKMVAYQAESDLVRIVRPHYKRAEEEGRTLVQNVLSSSGDIRVSKKELHVAIEPLSSPHRTQSLAALCREINGSPVMFPGTKLKLRFSVKPEPPECLAFPGPSRAKSARRGAKPDKTAPG